MARGGSAAVQRRPSRGGLRRRQSGLGTAFRLLADAIRARHLPPGLSTRRAAAPGATRPPARPSRPSPGAPRTAGADVEGRSLALRARSWRRFTTRTASPGSTRRRPATAPDGEPAAPRRADRSPRPRMSRPGGQSTVAGRQPGRGALRGAWGVSKGRSGQQAGLEPTLRRMTTPLSVLAENGDG